DGRWITYDNIPYGHHEAWKVLVDTTTIPAPVRVLDPANTLLNVAQPAFSPDGKEMIAGIGFADIGTTLIDPSLSASQKDFPAYSDYLSDNISVATLSPRWALDGTRVAIHARPPGHLEQLNQLWASRRNMSLPPVISDVGQRPIQHATPYRDTTIELGQTLSQAVTA